MITVYWALPDCISRDLAGELRAILDADESARAEHLRIAEDKHAFIVAHALLRVALHDDAAPGEPAWTLARAADGKPVVIGADGGDWRHVSVSHVRTCVACAVSGTGSIGIDVERAGRVPLDEALLRASCTAREIEELRASGPPDRERLFARLWTRKEACYKAGPAEEVRDFARFDASVDASPWRIVTFEPDPLHVISVASCGPEEELDVRQLDGDALWRARHRVRTAR